MVWKWEVFVLRCVEHGGCKGLTANPSGERHGVIIPVPVEVMEKAKPYRFVLHFYDDYADSYKDHKPKASLEVNAVEVLTTINLVASDLFKSPILEDEEENPGTFVHFNLDNDNDSDNSDGAPKHPGGDYIANCCVEQLGSEEL
jgi:hypothetical protein